MLPFITPRYYKFLLHTAVNKTSIGGADIVSGILAVLKQYINPYTNLLEKKHHVDFARAQIAKLSADIPSNENKLKCFFNEVVCYFRLRVFQVKEGGDFYTALKVILHEIRAYCQEMEMKLEEESLNRTAGSLYSFFLGSALIKC